MPTNMDFKVANRDSIEYGGSRVYCIITIAQRGDIHDVTGGRDQEEEDTIAPSGSDNGEM